MGKGGRERRREGENERGTEREGERGGEIFPHMSTFQNRYLVAVCVCVSISANCGILKGYDAAVTQVFC